MKSLKNLNLKIIIFDFDGIIIDSNHKKENALIRSISEVYQIDLSVVKEFIENNPGKNREYYFEYFFKISDISSDNLQAKVSKLFSENVKAIYQNANIENNLEKLKMYFPQSRWFIISSANRDEIIEILNYRNILHLFDDVYGGPQTKYENYLANIENLHHSNEEVLHIGDGNQDIKLIEQADISGLLLTQWSMEPNLLLNYKNSEKIFVYQSLEDFIIELG